MFLAEFFFTLGKEGSLPSVFDLALGKELLCRVPEKKHSANHFALGKEWKPGSASVFVINLAKEWIKLTGLKSFAYSATSRFGISTMLAPFRCSNGPALS
jgi:hypothetical protein